MGIKDLLSPRHYPRITHKSYAMYRDLIRRVLALIPDDQTELDWSGEDLSSLSLSSYDLLVEYLPARINSLDLRDVNLNRLHLFNIQELSKIISLKRKTGGRFEELKFSMEDLQRFFADYSWEGRQKIGSLSAAMAEVNTIHVISASTAKVFQSAEELIDFLKTQPQLPSEELPRLEHPHENLLKFIIEVRAKIDRLKQARYSLFNSGKLHKAEMIEAALERAIESEMVDLDLFVRGKHQGSAYSLFDALNYNRLWIQREHTTTLRELHTSHPLFNLIPSVG
ncbi:hypothetical protein Lqui_0890 [Legionella quinlivanii]|uniref:Uncharacterized protein n=2 Tax=Legionella quinlivanii TaxID=45073 RepID=A0A0W0Y638_9GAMM|nr:hypothetical protein Lqui_0890 [Legionella quinlivanii]SEF88570.1 hypothetical protein SAMN02746093_01353 [Legionella quinlivanii DSM 21216]STY12458.1 Uncharacterised protein [Legionella quinlivanii]